MAARGLFGDAEETAVLERLPLDVFRLRVETFGVELLLGRIHATAGLFATRHFAGGHGAEGAGVIPDQFLGVVLVGDNTRRRGTGLRPDRGRIGAASERGDCQRQGDDGLEGLVLHFFLHLFKVAG